MLVDKDSLCRSDGLNQKFRISQDKKGRVKIVASNHITQEDLSQQILKEICVADEVDFIVNEMKFRDSMNFSDYVNFLSKQHSADIKIPPILGSFCKSCEFKLDPKNLGSSLKSGFQECWSEICALEENEPTILDVWKFKKTDDLIKKGVYRIKQLTEKDINPKKDEKPGMSSSQRQWAQIEKIINNDNTETIDIDNLRNEMNSWTYPLHFIDFETCMPAIPFNKGARPRLGLAFQFSHHILHKNGFVEHAGQYINEKIGVNPNLDFIRALRLSLENSPGTIFRYAMHENTYLNMIYDQLQVSADFIFDKDELLSFIEQISQSTNKKNKMN